MRFHFQTEAAVLARQGQGFISSSPHLSKSSYTGFEAFISEVLCDKEACKSLASLADFQSRIC